MPRTRKTKGSKDGKAEAEKSADQVFGELLQEVHEPVRQPDRPLKRRKIGHGPRGKSPKCEPVLQAPSSPVKQEDDLHQDNSESQSGDADDGEVDWDQLVHPDAQENGGSTDEMPPYTIAVDLNKSKSSPPSSKRTARLPSTKAERLLRLTIHKLHLCSLMAHVYIRNHWCNGARVQASLKNLSTKRTRSFLHPTRDLTQYDQSAQFVRGLEEASLAWRGAFRITNSGMRRAEWASEEPTRGNDEGSDEKLTSSSFAHAATIREGSRDVGVQLFCSLLRSLDVDTRLVCSLQPLPLTSSAPLTRTIPMKHTIDLSGSAAALSMNATTDEDTDTSMKSTASTGPRRVKRFDGRSSSGNAIQDLGRPPQSAAPKRNRIVDSPYPVFWVEAFNEARQKWIPADPLVTQSVNKAAKFEPPASDTLNDMSYVLALEDDGSARDVTRRYAKAYNAKTRKARVESTENGARWYKKALKIFTTPPSDRDHIELAELSKREAEEPLPRNISDYKDHPYYALTRHLRRHEIIHPLREVGKVSTGKSSTAVEPIYRRRDVFIVKSADKWYRLGREIKEGEQPLKLVAKAKRARDRDARSDEDGEEDEPGMLGLYAAKQTMSYIPPPVIGGRIPKNAFGNLDLYVSSMIPLGAVHVRAFDAAKAATVLGVDYADAVTGFTFKRRKGTAVKNGVVVAAQYREAMEEVVACMRWERERAELDRRSREALRLWKRFMIGLRIRERVMLETSREEDNKYGESMDVRDAIDEQEMKEEKAKCEGGFFLDAEQGTIAEPTAGQTTRGHDIETLRADAEHDLLPARVNYWEPTVTSPWDVPGAIGQNDFTALNNEAMQKLNGRGLIPEPSNDIPGGFEVDDTAAQETEGFARAASQNLPSAGESKNIPNNGPVQAQPEAPGGFLIAAMDPPQPPILSSEVTSTNRRTAKGADLANGSPTKPSDENNTNYQALPHELEPSVQAEREQPPADFDDKQDEDETISHDGSEDSAGSLMLEDPEDMDLEPEWLVDETGI